MWEIVAALMIWSPRTAPLAPPATTPYVSCIDGHIVKSLAECPSVPRHNGPGQPPVGGGPVGGGLLGGLVGGLL